MSLTEVQEGILNKNYVLRTSAGAYFIKAVREKSQKFLPHTAAVEILMKERGIPAVCMLATLAGKQWVEIGDAAYCVYAFIESDRTHEYSAEDYRAIGEMLARIHKAGSADIPKLFYDRERKENEPADIVPKLEEYRARIQAKEDADAIDDVFLEYIELKLSLIPAIDMSATLPNDTLVHGDYHAGNLLFDAHTREIIGVCDWEKAEVAPRAIELARTILYVCFDGAYDARLDAAFEAAYQIIEGYMSTYPMKLQELRDGFAMRLRRHVLSHWLENHYYDLGDARGNHFVAHETRLIRDFVQGDFVERLLPS